MARNHHDESIAHFAPLCRPAPRGEMGLVAYITAGDPSLDATEQFVLALANAGADVIELGVPFSDPVADGPVIQRASERALRGGTTLAGVLALVKSLRAKTEVPLVLFSYYNPVLQMGLEKFARRGKGRGRRWRADHRCDARGRRRISRGDVFARPRHNFSGRADVDRRATGADRESVERISVPDFAHRRDGRERSTGRGIAGAGAARAARHRTSHRHRISAFRCRGMFRCSADLADAAVVGSALVEEIERAAIVEAAAEALARSREIVEGRRSGRDEPAGAHA